MPTPHLDSEIAKRGKFGAVRPTPPEDAPGDREAAAKAHRAALKRPLNAHAEPPKETPCSSTGTGTRS